jgi:ankyrin repeat protein
VREISIPASDPNSAEYRALERLQQLDPDEAAEKLGREVFSDLNVTFGGQSELYTKEERWEEIRYNIRMSHGLEGSGYGYTLLHAFAFNGRLVGVKRLLELGYDVDATDKELWTGLHYASFGSLGRSNRGPIIRVLVEAGADIHKQHKMYGVTASHYVVQGNDISSATFLLSQGADINHNGVSNLGQNRVPRTPLCTAAAVKGAGEMIRFLLDRGAEINWRDACGGTALHKAANAGLDDNIKILLDRGANRFIKEQGGKTAADLARRWEYLDGHGRRLYNI